jgi:hypothetical protein
MRRNDRRIALDGRRDYAEPGGGAERLQAYRLPAQTLKTHFAEGAPCRVTLLKSTQALITQIPRIFQ